MPEPEDHDQRDLLERLRLSPGSSQAWTDYLFAISDAPAKGRLWYRGSRDIALWFPRTKAEFLIAITAARDVDLPEYEALLLRRALDSYPGFLEFYSSPLVRQAEDLAKRLAQIATSNSCEQLMGAMLQVDTWPANPARFCWWYSNECTVRTDWPADAIAFEDWVKLAEMYTDSEWDEEREFHPLGHVREALWPNDAARYLALLMYFRKDGASQLAQFLSGYCPDRKCESCRNQSAFVPVMDFPNPAGDLVSLACTSCGHAQDGLTIYEGFSLPTAWAEFFRAAGYVNLVVIRVGQLEFSLSRPICVPMQVMVELAHRTLLEFIRDELNLLDEARQSDWSALFASTEEERESGFRLVNVTFIGPLAGKESQFEERYIKWYNRCAEEA